MHRSTWEPRPYNDQRNHALVDPAAVHTSFSTRQRSTLGIYDPRWDSYLLPRVDGQFQGTTDEIFQWAACKWGLSDDVLRGMAVRESAWHQSNLGDWFTSEPYADRKLYCDHIATFGYDYQSDYGDGYCPKTFSIIGEMSWWSPTWGFNWAGNQNGTFPFNRDSTAFAMDYAAAHLRGCYNGWITWLAPSGDLWGCVGAWYSGAWHDAGAETYISNVKNEIANYRWLQPGWPAE